MKRLWGASLTLVLLICVPGVILWESQPVHAASSTVRIVDTVPLAGRYEPASLTIVQGDTVRWANEDNEVHTATGTGWNTGDIGAGKTSISIPFNQLGTYNYSCLHHDTMTGTVTVVEAASPTPPPRPSPSPPPPSPSPSPKPSPTASPSPSPSPTVRAPSPSPKSGEVVTGSVTSIDQRDKRRRPVGRIVAIVAGIVLAGSAAGLWLIRKTPA